MGECCKKVVGTQPLCLLLIEHGSVPIREVLETFSLVFLQKYYIELLVEMKLIKHEVINPIVTWFMYSKGYKDLVGP